MEVLRHLQTGCFSKGVATLQSSIKALNEFCADVQNFSYSRLAALKWGGFTLQVNATNRELFMLVSNDQHYKMIQGFLVPHKRLYELLGLHFQKVHIIFGLLDEPVECGIYLETIFLDPAKRPYVRNPDSLGARFRRVLNIAFQGHIGVLKLHNDREIAELKTLWERGRIIQLFEKYGIMPFDDPSGELVKLWKPGRLKEGKPPVIIIG